MRADRYSGLQGPREEEEEQERNRCPRRLPFGEREHRRPFMRAVSINYANRLTGGPPINIFMVPALRRTFSNRPEQIQSCKPGLILERPCVARLFMASDL